MYNYFNEKNENEKINHNLFNPNNQFNDYHFQTLQKARRDLIGEIQAIIDYDEHLHNTNDKIAKELWQHIKEEELVHVGELLGLLNHLDNGQKKHIIDGLKEFMEHFN